MASPQKKSKSTSRWGFSQLVASVESRLDTILADEEKPSKKPQAQPRKEAAATKRNSSDLSRSNSGTQHNDRLQERLAKAMAKKAGSRPESPMPPSEALSGSSTPLPAAGEPSSTEVAQALDSAPQINEADPEQEDTATIQAPQVIVKEAEPVPRKNVEAILNDECNFDTAEAPPSTASSILLSDHTSMDLVANTNRLENGSAETPDAQLKTSAISATADKADNIADGMQDEINVYIERIDALQAKLLYLTREAAESTRQAAAAAEAGSAEKKLLEKDEKIALLMEEGQKLSKTEMKHLTTIKKLRSQINSASKEQTDMKSRAEKAEKDLSGMEDRARRAEHAAKRAEDNLATSLSASRDFETVTKERNALAATVADMKAQLTSATKRAEQAEQRAQSNLLEKEKKRTIQLQDDLTSAILERELSEDKLRKEVRDLQASLTREKEHSRAMETEMLNEQAVLESKLESFRARAEEATSNDHGDAQAKLLRQIEMLQSQYSSASQNWQGIEGTLLTRIANLEKERDDTATREADARKKHRDVSLKSKHKDREMEEISTKLQAADQRLTEAEEEAQRSGRKVTQLTDELKQARQDIDEQRSQAEKELSRRIEEERTKWAAANVLPRLDSPSTSLRKGSGFDIGHLMSPMTFDRPHSRRSSAMHVIGLDSNTPPRQGSSTSFSRMTNGALAETPSIVTSMDDEYFANVPATPASQTHTTSNRGVQDIISTSTVAAGPSVQLVERMSANVRRLESEKAASKDELVRLTTQRDEARQEVVSLMREVEQKRAVDERLKKLEDDHKGLSDRYQTTLELLGEKSELVEELKADVTDVKQMYRELVDTMGK